MLLLKLFTLAIILFEKIDFYLIFYNFFWKGEDVVGNTAYTNNIAKITDLYRNPFNAMFSPFIALCRRFELEEQRTGACVDYVKFYAGACTGSPKINPQPYCDRSGPHNVSSSSTSMTLEFVTDGSARYRGFDIIFAAFTNGKRFLKLFIF